MNKKLEMFSLLIYDEADRILGAVCISISRFDVVFDIFEYSERLGYIANAGFSGTHFRVNERLQNSQLVDLIEKNLIYLNSLVGKLNLHVDMSPFHNLKGFVDFKKFYVDNFVD